MRPRRGKVTPELAICLAVAIIVNVNKKPETLLATGPSGFHPRDESDLCAADCRRLNSFIGRVGEGPILLCLSAGHLYWWTHICQRSQCLPLLYRCYLLSAICIANCCRLVSAKLRICRNCHRGQFAHRLGKQSRQSWQSVNRRAAWRLQGHS